MPVYADTRVNPDGNASTFRAVASAAMTAPPLRALAVPAWLRTLGGERGWRELRPVPPHSRPTPSVLLRIDLALTAPGARTVVGHLEEELGPITSRCAFGGGIAEAARMVSSRRGTEPCIRIAQPSARHSRDA